MPNAEYVVYATDGAVPSVAQQEAIYRILATLPYPLHTNPLNAPAVAALSAEQQALLKTDEPAVILAQLQAINPSLGIKLLPKSMAQFYLYAATEGVELSPNHAEIIAALKPIVEEAIAYRRAALNKLNKMLHADFTDQQLQDATNKELEQFQPWVSLGINIRNGRHVSDDKKFFKECQEANFLPHMLKIWMALNNSLAKELQRIDSTKQTEMLSLADEWTAEFHAYAVQNKVEDELDQFDFMFARTNINQLRQILELEIKALSDPQLQHLNIVYRGSAAGPDSDYILINAEPDHRLSYSDGIAAGLVNDKGGCAWQYMQLEDEEMDQPNTAYALLYDPASNNDIIIAPPLTNTVLTLAFNEEFHVRTNSTHNNQLHGMVKDQTYILSDMRDDRTADYFTDPNSLTAYLRANNLNDVSRPWPQVAAKPVMFSQEYSHTQLTQALLVLVCFAYLMARFLASKVCNSARHRPD